jgi:hypothetical protein
MAAKDSSEMVPAGIDKNPAESLMMAKAKQIYLRLHKDQQDRADAS